MKSTTLYALSLAVGMFLTVDATAQNGARTPFKQIKKFVLPETITESDYLPKTIVFKVSPQFRGGAGLTNIQHPNLQLALNYLGVAKLERKFPNHKAPERERNELNQKYADLSLIYQLTYTGSVDIETAANQLLASGALTYAEPHYIFKMFDYEPTDVRADSVAGQQRNQLKRIRAYKAWDLALGGSRGNASTVIGIVDSGSDLDHPDLAANIYNNPIEVVNGLDDDADGYIDNFQGWDMGGADYNAIVGDNNPNCVGANNNHGSHVSGCAAQVGDNGTTGGAGIGFNCKLLVVKASADNDTRGSGGVGYIIGGYEGITYAADHGAHVINCSWGGAGGGSFGQDVIDYATLTKNALVVAAAGNDGANMAYYPSAYTYVLSVAATNSTSDGKASFSNWDYTVDLSAPGNGIDATVYNNTYTSMSGTSMASPIVAGAAGLVKSKFPAYTAMQIGQRLKQTTDNNYLSYNATTNPNITNPAATAATYANKLGTGRLNAFRALVDPQAPSFVFQNDNTVDNNDMAFIIGDTLFISGDFVNYMSASTGATVATIKAVVNGTNVAVIDTVSALGALATNGLTNNSADPFKFKINPGTPLNTIITFRVQIKDGAYFNNYFFNVTTNVDYINIRVNDLQTTMTSKSKIGWNQDGATEGLGFTYLGTQMLYEGGFMVGTSATAVSDRVRGTTGTASDADFNSVVNISRPSPDVFSEFDTHGKFNDAAATPTQNVLVSHSSYAWSTPGNRKYVIVEYSIKNTGTTALNNLYAGIASDWDIEGPTGSGSTYANNKADYDASRKMGYAWNISANGKYAGIRVLNPEAANHYGIDNAAGGAGGMDINDAGDYYSTADKYLGLSTPRQQAGFADANGEDVLNIVSSGPFTINAGDSIKVAFALICGDDLNDLQESSDSAQVHYNVINPVGLKSITKNDADIKVYPNPASNTMFISIDNQEEGNVSVDLFNLVGQKVMSVSFENKQDIYSVDISNLNEGAYLYRVNKGKEGNASGTSKLTVGKIIVTKSNK